jgi:4a-hydroxytetrahydrobiopterin dehydratase
VPLRPLSGEEARRLSAELPGWELGDGRISRTYEFAGFAEAIAFVNRVARLAAAADHHPDIVIRYARVTLTLRTHDAGGLTARDFALAKQVDTP